MIGLYDYSQALSRYKNRNLRKGDSKILWAGISTAGNSGADVLITDSDYAKALSVAYEELYTQLEDGHDVDDMLMMMMMKMMMIMMMMVMMMMTIRIMMMIMVMMMMLMMVIMMMMMMMVMTMMMTTRMML